MQKEKIVISKIEYDKYGNVDEDSLSSEVAEDIIENYINEGIDVTVYGIYEPIHIYDFIVDYVVFSQDDLVKFINKNKDAIIKGTEKEIENGMISIYPECKDIIRSNELLAVAANGCGDIYLSDMSGNLYEFEHELGEIYKCNGISSIVDNSPECIVTNIINTYN